MSNLYEIFYKKEISGSLKLRANSLNEVREIFDKVPENILESNTNNVGYFSISNIKFNGVNITANERVINLGEIDYYIDRFELKLEGKTLVSLTPRESAMFELLARNIESLVTFEMIARDVYDWPMGENEKRTIRVMVSRLRNKLEKSGISGIKLKTIRGIGYILEHD